MRLFPWNHLEKELIWIYFDEVLDTIKYVVFGDCCIIALCNTLSVRTICFRLNNSISSLCCTIWCFQYYQSVVIVVVVMVLFRFLTDNRTTIGLFCLVAIYINIVHCKTIILYCPETLIRETFHKICLVLSNWYWLYY